MSFKSSLVKIAIKMTPNMLIVGVANIILKGIAELSDFVFDLDSRSIYVRVTLAGEQEAIEVSIDDFAIISNEDSHHFIIQKAQSNRLWLNNILSRFIGKTWKIPEQPKYKAQIELVAELLKAEEEQQEVN